MRKNFILLTVALMMGATAFAQTADQKPAVITEAMYILPKRGMADKLEAAIKAHDMKYHPDGPYVAGLRSVDYGTKAGWYVWIMGPTSYAALDSRPDKGEHADDWSKNVDPLIEQYGSTDIWEFNADLSTSRDLLLKAGHYDVWAIDLKRGQYYRFKALAENLKKTYESMGNRAFLIYNNPIHSPDGADVAILTSYTSYADWGQDWGVQQAYEKLFGEGSWQHALDEWYDVTNDYTEELRSIVK